jgi:hypothetical protein
MFRPGGPVADLARRAAESVDLLGQLQAGLEPGLAAALRAAQLKEDGTLVVAVSSSAWAARLRFATDQLLLRCRASGRTCERVEVRVAGPAGPTGR